MKRQITISYQNRQSRGYGGSGIGTLSRDLRTAPKLLLSNFFISDISKFEISEKVMVEYRPNLVIISKINSNL